MFENSDKQNNSALAQWNLLKADLKNTAGRGFSFNCVCLKLPAYSGH